MDYLIPPDPRLVNRISTRLNELNIYLPADHTALVISAMLEWLLKTTDGKHFLVETCGFDWERGKSDTDYHDITSREKLDADDIYFLFGAVVKGEFTPPSNIDMCPKDKSGCDECGILSHCTREVIGNHNVALNVCNRCLAMSENPLWRDKSGGNSECENCSVMGCQYHPSKNVRRLYA